MCYKKIKVNVVNLKMYKIYMLMSQTVMLDVTNCNAYSKNVQNVNVWYYFFENSPFLQKNIFKLRTGIKISFKIIKCVI